MPEIFVSVYQSSVFLTISATFCREINAVPSIFETDADHIVQEPQIKGDILLENNGLTVSVYSEGEKTYLQITGSDTDDFQIVTYTPDLRSDYDGMWVNVFVPAGCRYNDEVPPPGADADQTLQLECTCYSRPELSFITGMMKISE